MHTFMIAQNDTTLKLLIFRLFPHPSLPQFITKIKIQQKFNFQKNKILPPSQIVSRFGKKNCFKLYVALQYQ